MRKCRLKLIGGLGGPLPGGYAYIAAECTLQWPHGPTTKARAIIDTGAGRSWIDSGSLPPKSVPAEQNIPAMGALGQKSTHFGYAVDILAIRI